jgi:formylglycine-generating enzyme required for sulfatase activity
MRPTDYLKAKRMTRPSFLEHAELTKIGPLLDPDSPLAIGDPAELASIAESGVLPLRVRLAAGTVLALHGDSRLDTVPTLVEVRGGEVEIGLRPKHLDQVSARWQHVGVDRAWIEKETPAFATRLDAFYLGRYPVTNSQYRDFLNSAPWQHRPSTWYLGAYPWDRANHPVCGVTSEDTDAYLAWLSRETDHPYRLPTEAEWEHAAKGFEGREYPWGEEFDPANANTRETGLHTTSPVGIFPDGDSPFGVADMAGNVEEYVADLYRPYPGGEPVEDHLTHALGSYRVTRGGSFARHGDLARTRRRHGPLPGPLYPCGFRIATSEPPE